MKKTLAVFSFFAFINAVNCAFATETVTSYEALLELLENPNADVILDMQGNGIDLDGGHGVLVQNAQSVIFSNIGTDGSSSWTNTAYNIKNNGSISVINSIFEENNPVIGSGSANGGGIIRNVGGTISTIKDSSFNNNHPVSTGALWGGIISNLNGGYIGSIENVSFENNFAYAQTAAPHGGVLYNESSTIDVIQNVVFKDNTMTSAPDKTGGAHGTAIDNNEKGIINKITNVQFINNKAYRTGYAELSDNYHASAAALDNYHYIGEISNVLFYQNSTETESSSARAGSSALMNLGEDDEISGTIEKIENVQFIENHTFAKRADTYGGAMTNGLFQAGATAVISEMNNVIFKGNYAQSGDEENIGSEAYGGALRNGAEIRNLTSSFENNYVISNRDDASFYGSMGGAICDDGKIGNLIADFKENHALVLNGKSAAGGGAIDSGGTINTIVGNFINNYASSEKGGSTGGSIHNTGEITNLKGYFEKNYAQGGRDVSGSYGSRGGAIYNTGTIENITADFKENYASNIGSSSAGGGAIYHKGTMNTITGNFTNNYASSDKGKANGGAILNQSNSSIEKIYGNFMRNKVSSEERTADGGAINNIGQINLIKGDFIENEATSGMLASGGGIYNKGTINLVDSSFVSNKADKGAAIYNNAGTLSLTALDKNIELTNNNQTGTSEGEGTGIYIENGTFLLNAANDKTITINDLIYSDGIIRINSDETHNGGTIALNNKLEGNGQFHIQNGNVILGSGSNISAASSTVSRDATFDVGSNTISTGNTQISGTIKMNITNMAKDSEEYNGGKINANNLIIDDTAVLSLSISNGLMNEKGAKTGDLELISQTNDTPNVFENIVSNNRYAITASKDGIGQYNGKYQIEYIATSSDVVKEASGTQNNMRTAEVWDKANLSNPKAQQAQELLYELSQHDAKKYVKTLTNLAPTDTMLHVNITQDLNNLITDKVAAHLNVQGINSGDSFEKTSAWVQTLYNKTKLEKTHQNSGFKGKMSGVTFGIDGKLEENTTLGIGYAYGQADVDSDKRDTDVTSHTIYVYGKYQPSEWYIGGLMNYGFAKYDEKANVAGLMNKSHYDVQNYGIRAYTGYHLQKGITPQTELRYTHIERENYTDSFGQHIKTDDSDVLTAAIGIQYKMKIETKNILWTPKAHLTMIYDLLSSNSSATVHVGNGSYTVEAQKLNRYGIEAGVGTDLSINRWDFSVEYELAARKNYKSHTGLLKAKYNF